MKANKGRWLAGEDENFLHLWNRRQSTVSFQFRREVPCTAVHANESPEEHWGTNELAGGSCPKLPAYWLPKVASHSCLPLINVTDGFGGKVRHKTQSYTKVQGACTACSRRFAYHARPLRRYPRFQQRVDFV